ncbi:hypothetical protein Trydic_g7207 [Trypoxylus dichotomus]
MEDCRPDNIHKATGGSGRLRRYLQLPIRVAAPPIHQVLRIVEQIKEGLNLREYTGAVFLYVAKAFDKVWHQGLLLKMHRAGIFRAMVRLIHSYFCKRAFKTKLEGQRSTVRIATAGVPQGSAISPLLFNIYTSDINATAYVNLAMYADDVCIFARSQNARIIDRRRQTLFDTLQAWYAKWRIAVHPEKTTAVLFSRGDRRRRKHDSRVNWGAHIQHALDQGPQLSGTLYPLLMGRGKPDISLKIRIYKTVLRPIITYASAVLAIAAPRAFNASWFVTNTTIQEDAGVDPSGE